MPDFSGVIGCTAVSQVMSQPAGDWLAPRKPRAKAAITGSGGSRLSRQPVRLPSRLKTRHQDSATAKASAPRVPLQPECPSVIDRPASSVGFSMLSSSGATAQQKRPSGRRKRVVTEARKEQNRVAQRTYRRRQKEERLKKAQPPRAHRYPTLLPQPAPEDPENSPSYEPLPLGPSNLGDNPVSDPSADMDWNNIADRLDESDNAGKIVSSMPNAPDRHVGLTDDLLRVGIDTLSTVELGSGGGYAPGDDMTRSPNQQNLLSGQQWLIEERPESQEEWNPVAQEAACVGVRSTFADLYQNRLEFSQMSFLQACCFNARCLGIGAEEFAGYSCLSFCSPFYRPVTITDDPKALLAAVSRPATPPHLQPTLPQVLFPHHPILDLLPLPQLRARAIMLAATAPLLLDAFDLKKDVIEGGLICWAAQRGGNSQPWDKRSWEAAPWFLQKWRLLVDGPHSDLWQQSAWWQGMRGEPPAC